MKEKGQNLNFININVNKIHAFLDRFSQFDENLLLEVTPDVFYAKTYTPDRSAIKYSALTFEEILQVKDEQVPDNLKIGLINVKHYQQALKFLLKFLLWVNFTKIVLILRSLISLFKHS